MSTAPTPLMKLNEIAGEFKTFILKGNVVDLAVGVVIGTAFKSVIDAVVASIINPLLALMHIIPGVPTVSFVAVLHALITFTAIAAVVFFFVVKPMNLLVELTKRRAADGSPEPVPLPEDVKLLMEIRDLLKASPPR